MRFSPNDNFICSVIQKEEEAKNDDSLKNELFDEKSIP